MFFIAVKQQLSDFLFQLADALCYGGLGNVEGSGGLRKTV